MSVRRFTSHDPDTWYQREGSRIFLADVLDAANSDTMSVGFARYDEGASNAWTTTYDEALIITRGRFTVRSNDGAQTADAGEVIYLTRDTELVYHADEDTELVYVTYPHWADATRNSPHAAALDDFHPVGADQAART